MTLQTKLLILLLALLPGLDAISQSRHTSSFNDGWHFRLGEAAGAEKDNFDDATWRRLELPHDWSIELPFDKESPSGIGGGALRGGMGWYRKAFSLRSADKDKYIAVTFDGIYRNSEAWINGHYLGKRPNGYISFQYDLTPYLRFGNDSNILAVKVDNSDQPNSRWYSGSGIYRNVWLTITGKTHVDYLGSHFTTPSVSEKEARVKGITTIANTNRSARNIIIQTKLLDAKRMVVSTAITKERLEPGEKKEVSQDFAIINPALWSVDRPQLYQAVTTLEEKGRTIDEYTTSFGVRSFTFDMEKGFLLNGTRIKIRGVCNHHDLGCLGTAVNKSAIRRQLRILKEMGCNGIRTSHNPPAPELLDCCDEMGFIVMDESFDMWKQAKSKYDYHLDWEQWYRRDLEDQVRRDRNHPSVFIWSLGNEIPEQWAKQEDTAAAALLRELHAIVKDLDDTRLTVTANNEIGPGNRLLQAGVTDMIGYNYNHLHWDSVYQRWGRKPFIVTESVSALQTRGHYDMPADSIRRWPTRWDVPLTTGNADTTCSAYDNCSTPWGSTHEETLKEFERYDHISGMYIWTGFDYIGEPTPYAWPARSSYFGIVDLAGFPKDVYYMYQSVWTNRPVLHLLPHWNWKEGQQVDVWAYYSQADEVELFLNGVSLGVRQKRKDELHVSWQVSFHAGILKAVSRKKGKTILVRETRTAGPPARIILETDHTRIDGKRRDLAFITAKVVDTNGNLVPDADNLVQFFVDGGTIAGTDNGNQTSLESFQAPQRKAFNGLCLAVLRANATSRVLTLTASSQGLQPATIRISPN